MKELPTQESYADCQRDWCQDLSHALRAREQAKNRRERQTCNIAIGRILCIMPEHFDKTQDYEYICMQCGLDDKMMSYYRVAYKLHITMQLRNI